MTAFAWNARLVSEALGLKAASWEHAYTGISTDTRSLKAGELFIALKGETFDAHDYLSDARLAEAGGVVVRKGTPRWPGFDSFEVDDTLVALGELARFRRSQFPGTVVAVTGSNGKTSTRELIAAALSGTRAVHKSQKNLNNLVGVPLTVLAAPVEATAMVIECGASVKGEIARLRRIVRPDIAVVTNVSAAHVEGFGSLAGVMEEKLQLLADAPVAVVGTDPPELASRAGALAQRVVTASTTGQADWTAETITLLEDGRPRFTVRGTEITLPLRGRHMVANALIALAVADAAGIGLIGAAAGLERAAIPGGRSDVRDLGGTTVINDTYNANPASLRAALDLLEALRGKRRAVVVVGTMRELGAESARLHQQAAEAVAAAKPAVIGAVGEFVAAFRSLGKKKLHETRLVTADGPEALAPALRELLKPKDVVLLKASRGVTLERIIPLLWPEAH